MEFWELEDHEVAYSWFRASKMHAGNGVLAAPRAILRGCLRRFGFRRQPPRVPPRPPVESSAALF
eukprot:3821656-Pyramimonas_sp.AAC.1